jgi:two-component sensor histidine kinase
MFAARAVREGAQDYLVKGSVDSNLLVRSIRYAIERKQAQEVLRGYSERLKILHEIDQAILAADSPAAIAQAALDRLGRLIDCPYALVVTFNFAQHEVVALSTYVAQDADERMEARFPVAELQRLRQHEQTQGDPAPLLTTAIEQFLCGSEDPSYVSLPLSVRNELIGMLVLGTREQRPPLPEQLDVARDIARSLAMAIQQANLRKKLEVHSARLEASLGEKEVLLKEIHHRVKNNLQITSSLLYLQSANIDDVHAHEVLQESQNRIRSMALIHEKLYRSDDLSKVDFAAYIGDLTRYLFSTYRIYARAIGLQLDVQDTTLSIDTAIPCGLIINELVSNALKHAFPDGRDGEIRVSLEQTQSGYQLAVRDNGIGLPPDLDLEQTDSLGLQLVLTLVDQLDASIELGRNGGTEVAITFNN